MQKIFETLKRRETCWIAILVVLAVIIVYLQMDRSNLQIDNEKLQKIVEEQQTEKKQLQADKEELQADNGILQAYSEELELANGRAQETISKLRTSNKNFKKTLKAMEKSIDLIEVEKGIKLDDGKVVMRSLDQAYIYPHHYNSEVEAMAHPNLLYTLEKTKSEVAMMFHDLFIYYGTYFVTLPSGKKQKLEEVDYSSPGYPGGDPPLFQFDLKERGIYLIDLNYEDKKHEYFALLW